MNQFFEDFDDLVEVAMNSTRAFYGANLRNLFDLLDGDPNSAREVKRLENLSDFEHWYSDLEERQRTHGVGGPSLDFPHGRDEALGMQMSLLRRMSDGTINPELFAHAYLTPNENNINRGLEAFSRQILMPTAKSLRRRLERLADDPSSSDIVPPAIPASDRTVTLNHNSPEYEEATQALAKVEQAVQESNDYDDLDDKDQRVAEISAARRLLQATRMRVESFVTLVRDALSYLAKKFADATIGEVAKGALALLGKLTGLW